MTENAMRIRIPKGHVAIAMLAPSDGEEFVTLLIVPAEQPDGYMGSLMVSINSAAVPEEPPHG